MRKDMDKILVTTARIGSDLKNQQVIKERRSKDWEDLPSKSSMKPNHARYTERKQLNEYLNPLIRFLKKNCGKKWDDIYSDICSQLDKRTAVQDHIFMHLFDFVEIKPDWINGFPHYNPKWGTSRRIYKTGSNFYVNKNGILKEPKHKSPSYSENKNSNLFEKNNKLYIKDPSGTWFEAIFLPVDPIWSNFNSIKPWIREIFGKNRLMHKKVVLKTLSKKHKKNLGL